MTARMMLRKIPRVTLGYSATVIVLAIVLGVQNIGGRVPNTVEAPTLPEFVERIEIEDNSGLLTLEKREERWTVSGRGASEESEIASVPRYEAREETVTRLLERLRELNRLDLVSARGNYHEYGLVEGTRRVIRLEGREGGLLTVELGFSASTGDAVYGRINGTRPVVRLPRALHNLVGTEPDRFRELVVARIATNAIRRIEIKGADPESVEIRRIPGAEEEYEWEVSGATVQPQRVDDLLSELATLSATGFPENEQTPTDTDPFVELLIETVDGVPQRIRLYPPDEERRFPARSSTTEHPFYLPEWRVRRLLLGIEGYLVPFMDEPPAVRS